jgi:flagellar FliL protein
LVVYFVTATILLNKVQGNEVPSDSTAAVQERMQNRKGSPVGNFLYSIDDIIVNPAGTNGDQLLLTSIAFDLASQESEKVIKEKEIVVWI